ncbi:hypothetical protein CLOM_g20844 [Closterium sp. NIES-68]|nr:hypothetical protein CLOM_g20844 [Closterium sp. NIES-68]
MRCRVVAPCCRGVDVQPRRRDGAVVLPSQLRCPAVASAPHCGGVVMMPWRRRRAAADRATPAAPLNLTPARQPRA